jgi:hypothetical protein
MEVLLVFPTLGRAEGAGEPNAGTLKREVAERERHLTRAERDLAEARARLALAEGRKELALVELRKAVAACQGEAEWIQGHVTWFCDPRELLNDAHKYLAQTRAWLAEVEGDTATLVTEWKKIVAFHELDLDRVRRLERMLAVSSADVTVVQQALDQARQRLQAAEKQLTAERAKKPNEAK